jgi:hypothetical protein
MRKWMWVAPVLLVAAGCSRNSSTSAGGPVLDPPATSTPGGGRGSSPAAPAPVRQATVIPSGTPLHVRLDSEVDTKHNRAGDGITASLVEPLVVDGLAVLPEGTRFTGHVTRAGASG